MTAILVKKVALVIGGGSWIGESIAKRFAEEGATVIIAGRTISKLKKVAEEIINAGGDAFYQELDICHEDQVIDVTKSILKAHHKIDILVNSAAIYPRSLIEDLSLTEWREVIDINLTGSFILLKYVAEIMKKQNFGRVVFVSSVAGEKIGIGGLSHYCASKAGVNGFMRAAAIELAPYNIMVNSINPGNILNRERAHVTEDKFLEMQNAVPLKRVGKPEEIANLALFLASDSCSFITGQDYTIDGGETITKKS
jgi:3-oxoacyl-[acyl-carrier protein] reductase